MATKVMPERQVTAADLAYGSWILVAANKFWLNYVFAFSLAIKVFQLLCMFKYWRFNHALRVEDGQVTEMLAEGKTSCTIAEWLERQDRDVLILKPLVAFEQTEQLPYATFDIPQIVLHWIRKKLNFGNTWNGTDGVPEKKKGYYCSEEVAAALGRKDAHLIMPCMLPLLPEVEIVGYIETKRA